MVKLHIFSNLKERLISSVWMTAFFLLLVGVVHFFHGSREVAYGILLMFAVGCLTEWGYACFLSGGLKGTTSGFWVVFLFLLEAYHLLKPSILMGG